MDVPGTNQDKGHLTQKARVAVRDRIILRDRVPGDDEQLVALLNDLLPEFPAFTVDEFRFVEDNRSTDLVTERWVAELDGAIVGTAGLFQMRMGVSDVFSLANEVHRGWQGRGIGGMLYEHMLRRA